MSGMLKLLQKGDPIMYLNLIILVIVIGVVVERFIFLLTKGQINGKGLLEQLRKLVQANNVDRAIRMCGSNTAPLLRVAKAGLVQVHRGEEQIATSVEEALVEATPDVKKRIAALWSLANIATLIGLLGTVMGLIKSFGAIDAADPAERAKQLAAGIAQALNHTASGLSIAVVAIIFHLILTGISKKVVGELELFSMKLENFLIGQARGGNAGAKG